MPRGAPVAKRCEALDRELGKLLRRAALQNVLLAAGIMALLGMAAAYWWLAGSAGRHETDLAESAEQYVLENLVELRKTVAAGVTQRAPDIAEFAGQLLRDQLPALRMQADQLAKEGVARLLAARKPKLVAAVKSALRERQELLRTAAPKLGGTPADAEKAAAEIAAALEPVLAAEHDRTLAASVGILDGIARALAAANGSPATPLAEMHRDALRLAKQFAAELAEAPATPKAPPPRP